MSAIFNRFRLRSKDNSFFWRLQRQLAQRKTETLKLVMLTSCQQPAVPTFVSKQRTQVCFCASDQSYVAFNVLYMVCHPCENSFMKPPSPSEITAFEPPLPLGISHDLPWGGGRGYGYFLEPHISLKLFLEVVIKQKFNSWDVRSF